MSQVRSTLIASSLMVIRSRGHLEPYLAHLPPEHHQTVQESVAGSWLPLETAAAHYKAANAMSLRVQEIDEIGREVAVRIQNSLLGTLVRVAKTAGVTPWTGLEQFQRLWDRLLQGGSGAVYRLGPKEARVEMHGIPLVAIPYFRQAWRGMFYGSGSLFCSKLYVNEIPRLTSATTWALRVSWV